MEHLIASVRQEQGMDFRLNLNQFVNSEIERLIKKYALVQYRVFDQSINASLMYKTYLRDYTVILDETFL